MDIFDLAVAYVWEYDEEFVVFLKRNCSKIRLTTFRITEKNVFEVTKQVKNHQLHFISYLDRASDVDDDFLELAKILTRRKVRIFNPYKNISHAIDKATMHLEFITSGIHVPYSIIIPPHSQAKEI